MSLTATYNSFAFTDGEILDVRSSQSEWRTPRGERVGNRVSIQLAGVFKTFDEASPQAALKTRMDNLIAASAGSSNLIVQANGVNTSHVITESETEGGVRAGNLSFGLFQGPYGVGTELYYTRAFSISFSADVPDSGVTDAVVSYNERVITVGDGGPRDVTKVSLRGDVIKQQVAASTPVRVIQTGSAVGLTDYVSVPSQLYPDDVIHEQVELQYGAPTVKINGDLRNYPCTWTFPFELTSAPGSTPQPGAGP